MLGEVAIRVPSVGLTLEERRIVREGYRLAECLLRDQPDPAPALLTRLADGLAACRKALLGLYRAAARE